jgi:photosystem II stability/assembly factor-like uncharacterized protein
MKKYFLLLIPLIPVILFLVIVLHSSAAYPWIERKPLGNVIGPWRVTFISPDGSRYIAAEGDNLYISNNGGAAWTQSTLPELRWIDNAGIENWSGPVDSIASNTDGSKLVVSVGARIFISSDGGKTWEEKTPEGDFESGTYTVKVASSADGGRLFAVYIGAQSEYQSKLFVSSDAGDTWIERYPIPPIRSVVWTETVITRDANGNEIKTFVPKGKDDWGAGISGIRSLAISANGMRVLLSSENRLYSSVDGGTTWKQLNPAVDVRKELDPAKDPSGFFQAFPGEYGLVGSSADGLRLFATFNVWKEKYGEVAPGKRFRLYSSTDGGNTWNEQYSDAKILAFATNAYATLLISATEEGRLYTSHDAGARWIETQPEGNVPRKWGSVAVNSDGSRLIVGAYEGRIFTLSLDSTPPSLNKEISRPPTMSKPQFLSLPSSLNFPSNRTLAFKYSYKNLTKSTQQVLTVRTIIDSQGKVVFTSSAIRVLQPSATTVFTISQRLTSLKPGTYTMQVKVMNKEGKATLESNSFKFKVL